MQQTFFLIYSQYNDDFISSNSDKFVDTSDPSSGEFTEKDHAFDVVVFEQFDVGAHFCDLTNLHDDEFVDCWELVFIEATVTQRPHAGEKRGDN